MGADEALGAIAALRLGGVVLGAALLAITLFDVVWTTLGARGGGPLSGWLGRTCWRLALAVHHRWPSDRRLAAAGIGIVIAGFAMWTLLLWLGWLLVFLGALPAVLESTSRAPADLWERIYFVGYSVVTLGIGDFVPGDGLFRFLTILASITGFFVLTLSVTYLLSLLPAVVSKRSTADYIAALGLTPGELLTNQWRSDRCTSLLEHVPTLMQTLGNLAQQHTAYPVLHYFHAGDRRSALPLRVAALSDAFLLLDAGVVRCEATAFGVRPLRRTVRQLLGTLAVLHLAPSSEAPPPPPLRAAELPDGARSEAAEEVAAAAEGRDALRRLLLRYVESDGWRWNDVYASDEGDEASSDAVRTASL